MKRDSFSWYVVSEAMWNVIVIALALVSLPLWLPFWIWLTAREWVCLMRWNFERSKKYPAKDKR